MQIHKLQSERSQQIQEMHHVSALCAKVLASRGLKDEQIAELLQKPQLADPFTANGMQEVAKRIYQAKQNKERVMVCGDYDADGICSTAILVDALRRYGIQAGFYIPNRFAEGYGLQKHTVELAHEKGYSLLITVDNGVKALDALTEARNRGVDVIVTDHHAMDEEFPCLYLLHPFLMGERFETLSGAGVALEISRALLGEVKEHVVLACVAAIADVMPLRQETRAIVQLGLQYLRQGICQPIQLLANDRYPKWDETLIAFQIVPKLNTTGRLADIANANNTVRYLLSTNLEQLQHMAKQIRELNVRRKTMSDDMVKVARTLVRPEYRFQLLFHDSFHEGMAGLVAGKLSEELQLPVMVAAQREQMFKGSIRSLDLLDLTTFFDACRPSLSAYGGHKAAAGIGFPYENKQIVQDYVNTRMEGIHFQQEKSYDVIPIRVQEATLAEVESLSVLGPFGCGFEEPLFYLEEASVQGCRLLGNREHAKWILSDSLEAMYFRCGNAYERLHEKNNVNFIGNLRINSFMGRKKVNIFVTEAY